MYTGSSCDTLVILVCHTPATSLDYDDDELFGNGTGITGSNSPAP
jgi:hypothetical protein